MARRQIHAEFDEDGVIVYQAFKSSIADEDCFAWGPSAKVSTLNA